MIRDVHPRSGSRIWIMILLPVPDPRGQKGTKSRIRIRNIAARKPDLHMIKTQITETLNVTGVLGVEHSA